jgi:hypothetical protein
MKGFPRLWRVSLGGFSAFGRTAQTVEPDSPLASTCSTYHTSITQPVQYYHKISDSPLLLNKAYVDVTQLGYIVLLLPIVDFLFIASCIITFVSRGQGVRIEENTIFVASIGPPWPSSGAVQTSLGCKKSGRASGMLSWALNRYN